MNEMDFINILQDYLSKEASKGNGSTYVDILKMVIPIVSTFIAYFLGSRQAQKMLLLSKKHDVIEKQIQRSNIMVLEFIELYKELEIMQSRYKKAVGNNTNPIDRLFLTRFYTHTSLEQTVKPTEISFVHRFNKSVSKNHPIGFISYSKIRILIINTKTVMSMIEAKKRNSQHADKLFRENSEGLGYQNIKLEMDPRELWKMLYENESFLEVIDKIKFAVADFLTSYPNAAKDYFASLSIQTSETPIKSVTFGYSNLTKHEPIKRCDWGLVSSQLNVSKEELQAQFSGSDYDVYIEKYEEYLKQFADRNAYK